MCSFAACQHMCTPEYLSSCIGPFTANQASACTAESPLSTECTWLPICSALSQLHASQVVVMCIICWLLVSSPAIRHSTFTPMTLSLTAQKGITDVSYRQQRATSCKRVAAMYLGKSRCETKRMMTVCAMQALRRLTKQL